MTSWRKGSDCPQRRHGCTKGVSSAGTHCHVNWNDTERPTPDAPLQGPGTMLTISTTAKYAIDQAFWMPCRIIVAVVDPPR
jgi:hypothetical protein